jgi:plasmid stabilization system protein ParE
MRGREYLTKRPNTGSGCDPNRLVAAGDSRHRGYPSVHRSRSPAYAELIARQLVASVERLESFPESRRLVPERQDPAIREIALSPYRIVYRYRAGVAEIATVFRSSRQFRESL